MASKEINEQVNPIKLTDNETGMVYTLEFDRESIKFAEARGFRYNEVGDYPMTLLPDMFYYAFRMHHKNISREKTDRIFFEDLGGLPEGMAERLGALYAATLESLTANREKEGKNSRITVEM